MKYIVSLFALLIGLNAHAQIDRSKAPEAGPAPVVNIGEYQTFTTDNGITVFLVENHKLPRIAMSLSLDNDPVLEEDKVGYVELMGEMLNKGTEEMNSQDFAEAKDFIGATIATSSRGVYASSLSKHKNKLFELASSVILRPIFPEEELEKLKQQSISSLKYSSTDPSSIMSNVRRAIYYGNEHPYGEVQQEENIERIETMDLIEFHQNYFKPNVCYLSIVGDCTLAEAKKLVEDNFGDWKKGDVPRQSYIIPSMPRANKVYLANKEDAVQSSINIGYPVEFNLASEDYLAATIASNILGGGIFAGRLLRNLREDKAYTYAANASLSGNKLVGSFSAFSDVRTEVTDSAITEFIYEIKKISKSGVTEDEVSKMKKFLTGVFSIRLEQPQTVAGMARNIARYDLSKDFYTTYLERLEAVTTEEVNAAARKYFNPESLNILVVGNKKQIKDKLKQFSSDGKVIVVNEYGEEIDDLPPMPEGLTANDVINTYIKAMGGEEALKAVKSLTYTANGSIMGQELEMKAVHLNPLYFKRSVFVGGQLMQKEVYNGKKNKGMASGMQGSKEMGEKELKEAKSEAVLFREIEYLSDAYTITLNGMELVNDMPAYVVNVSSQDDESKTEYFDVQTGLKVKSVRRVESPMGELKISIETQDYKTVDNIQYPHKMIQTVGPQKLEFIISEISINAKISKKEFSF